MRDMQVFAAGFAYKDLLGSLPLKSAPRVWLGHSSTAAMKINGRVYVHLASSERWEQCRDVVDIDTGEVESGEPSMESA
jgi:hypothetical protein